jgi:hypothetical protein
MNQIHIQSIEILGVKKDFSKKKISFYFISFFKLQFSRIFCPLCFKIAIFYTFLPTVLRRY